MLINAIKPDPADARKLVGVVQVLLFGKPVEVANFTADTTGYANQCAQLLVDLSDQHVTQLLKASARYCQATREALGAEREPFEHERAVLPLIDPVRLRIPINEHYDRYSELVIDGGAPDRPVIDRKLSQLGITPCRVRWVVMTHLHLDHTDELHYFPKTKIVVTRPEFEYPYSNLPELSPSSFEPHLVDYKTNQLAGFSQSAPLTDAGDVRLVATPGHTHYHSSVLFQADNVTLPICRGYVVQSGPVTAGRTGRGQRQSVPNRSALSAGVGLCGSIPSGVSAFP